MNQYCSDVEHDHYTAIPRDENSSDTRGENSSDTRGENNSDTRGGNSSDTMGENSPDKDLIPDNGDENIDKTNNETEEQNSDVEVDD